MRVGEGLGWFRGVGEAWGQASAGSVSTAASSLPAGAPAHPAAPRRHPPLADHPQWRTEPPYSGALGAMMAPAAFTSILLAVLAALVALYSAMALALRAGLLTPARLRLPLGAGDAEANTEVGRVGTRGGVFGRQR